MSIRPSLDFSFNSMHFDVGPTTTSNMEVSTDCSASSRNVFLNLKA